MTAPAAPGTYAYYFCSNWLLNANAHNSSLTPLGCLETDLAVVAPAPTCSFAPTTQTINTTQNASVTYSTTNATGVTYQIDGGTATVPAGNPFSIVGSGLSVGSHNLIMTVSGPGGSATCGTAGDLTVTPAPVASCTLSPAFQTIFNGTSAPFTYTTTNATSFSYKVDGASAVVPSGGSFSVAGLGIGTHNVIMTASNVSGSATCGVNGNVTVSSLPLPTVSLTAGGASSVTVQPNATTTLVWSESGANPGGASVTAPSSASLGTDFVSMTGFGGSDYFSGFIVAGGYVYELGGYSGTAWVNTFWRAPVNTNMANSAWTNLGTLPAAVPGSINDPFVIGNNVYIFGGYNTTAAAYVGTICTAPVATMNVPGNWTCPATLPAGATAALSHAYPVSIGDYVYRFGGYNGTTGVAAVARAPLSSPTSWTNYPSVLPQALMYPNPVIVGNYVYLLGGYSATASNPVSTIYRALITSDLTSPASWTSAGVLPTPIYIAAASVDTTNLYLAGGYGTGGTQLSTIYKISLATLSTGGAVAGSWTSAGSLPTGIYPAIPFIVENRIYMAGGWNTGTGYINKFFTAPFNDGLAYTSPSNLPWRTDGGNNSATTWPITTNSVTYTLRGTNATGQSTATAVVNEPDLCTNAPFTGIQNPLPSGVTTVGTTCTCTTGLWNGSACFVSPVISTPTISPLISGSITAVKRVKKGSAVTLNWNVTGLVPGDSNTSCSVSSFPASAMTVQTWDGTTAAWTQPASAPTVNITGPTTFTVSCSNATWPTGTISASAKVNLVPVFNEQ
jgi:hypothetical protein